MTKLSKFLASLILHRHNLQMIHWNAVGKHFTDVHTTLDDYIGAVTGNIDQVAEFIKMLDLDEPLPSFSDIAEFITHDDDIYIMVNNAHVDAKTAWDLQEKIFNNLIEVATDAREECPPDIQSEIDNMIYYYRTEGRYKCHARLVDTE